MIFSNMELHHSSQSKIPLSKKSSKPNLAKIFTERKSHKNLQTLAKFSDKYLNKQPDRLPILQNERQNPIVYLQNLQQNNKQIQKSLEQSFLTSSKWRSYNSPVHTPANQSKQKENILLSTFYTKKKELSAIKIYNHVNNDKQLSTKNFEQPEFLQFIQEAVSKSTKKSNFLISNLGSNEASGSNTKRSSKLKKGFDIKQNYTVGDHRKELQNLQTWIKSKVQFYESGQKQGEMMFVDRINFLNMAFSEVSRVAGTFSTETKSIIEYLHKKYYDYYNFLTQCMIEQNKKIKHEISVVEDKLLKTINYYEDKLRHSKQQNQEKSEKIVVNFQKCIEVKKKLEKENKEVKRSFNNEKKKTKLIQEALIKVVTMFLALGQKNIQEMTFSYAHHEKSDSQNQKESFIKGTMLAKSRKHIMTQDERQIQRRKEVFQQWCGYLIKMIHRILIKDVCHRQNIDIQTGVFNKQAFEIIKQYMVQNDESLSLADAEKILNNFLSTEEQEVKLKKQIESASNAQRQIKSKQLKELQNINRKFQNMYTEVSYQLPTFEEVYNKITVHDVDIQVNIKNQTENWGVQTFVETIQTSVMAVQKTKSRQVDVSSNYKTKNQIDSSVYMICQFIKGKKEKQSRQIKKHGENSQNYKSSYDKDVHHGQGNTERSLDLNQATKHQWQRNKKISKVDSNSQFQHLIQFVPRDGSSQQIGVNTIVTKMNSKNKTVEFNIPENYQQADNNVDIITSNGQEFQNQLSEKSVEFQQKTQSLIQDSIKLIQSEIKSKEGSQKKLGRKRRKNGFLITGDRKKTHLSQKFIRNESQPSIQSDISINSDLQSPQLPFNKKSSNQDEPKRNNNQNFNTKEPSLIKRDVSVSSQVSQQNFRISLDKQTNLHHTYSGNQKKYQTLQERLGLNRSFFNLSHVEYASKQDADVHRMKDHVIRVPKKKTYRQKFVIDPHDFHLQLAFKNHEKLKFLSSVTLWHPKLMFQMKKIRHRVNNIKPFVELDNKSSSLMKGYLTHIINPLLKDFLKSYCQEQNNCMFDFGENSLGGTSKGFKNLGLKKQLSETFGGFEKSKNAGQNLSYHQKLSPLLYNVINFTQYNQNKTSSDNQIFFSAMKTLRTKSSKMEAYNLLIEGRCVQFDILIKTIYQFNLLVNSSLTYNPQLSYFILETGLIEALQQYFSTPEIQKIVTQAKNFIINSQQSLASYRRSSLRSQQKRDSVRNNNQNSKKLTQNAKIPYFDLLLIIFKHLKEKQEVQSKKYLIVKQIICRNSQCISYEDIMHFLQCLPIQNDKRKKILDICLKHVVFWNSLEATIPTDIFFFILDKYELYNSTNGTTQNVNLIKQYIVNRCELYFKGTLQKVTKNPEWVLQSTYILSYKIPKLFHRILYQIKTGKNYKQKKLLHCLLTLIFCNLIDIQMEKRFMPSLFNGILAIPLI